MTAQNALKVIQTLRKKYPQKADIDLGNPEDTLIATILSARTTDIQVLKIFPALRKKFPNWKKLSTADLRDIEKSINTIGMFRTKARSLKGLAQKILADFNGKVPRTMDELVMLPGVGRKTASCVLTYCFGVPAVAVDTHVFRIAKRLGWSRGKNPEKVEKDIKQVLPQKYWNDVNRTMIRFGRDICTAKPRCWTCPVKRWCRYSNKAQKPLK